MLAPATWRRAMAWICGWLYVVGNITITLAVNFGTTLFFVACINVFKGDPYMVENAEGVLVEMQDGVFPAETYQVFFIFLAITFLCNLVSALGNRWLPWLDVSIFPFLFRRVVATALLDNTSADLPFARRLLPSSGRSLVFLPLSFPSLLLPRTAAATPPTCSATLRPTLDGLTDGPSALVSCTPDTRPRRPA